MVFSLSVFPLTPSVHHAFQFPLGPHPHAPPQVLLPPDVPCCRSSTPLICASLPLNTLALLCSPLAINPRPHIHPLTPEILGLD